MVPGKKSVVWAQYQENLWIFNCFVLWNWVSRGLSDQDEGESGSESLYCLSMDIKMESYFSLSV